MLRVRFHGRGGHGVKTASRILGTAAFLHGFQAQDFPVYGAERRGAPVAAFTRIDAEPIGERGVILDPDLILIADETLLADPAAAVLAGQEFASAVLVNSGRPAQALAAGRAITCPVRALDLTALTAEVLGPRAALSAALGAAACALAGLQDSALVEQAVREELAGLHLSTAVVDRNMEVVRRVRVRLAPVERRDRPPAGPPSSLHPPAHLAGPPGVPVIYAPGNAAERHTGSWRVLRPVLDRAVCTRCCLCLARCPDGAIRLDDEGYPAIDYDNCKGCMICARECPLHGIGEEKETHAW